MNFVFRGGGYSEHYFLLPLEIAAPPPPLGARGGGPSPNKGKINVFLPFPPPPLDPSLIIMNTSLILRDNQFVGGGGGVK